MKIGIVSDTHGKTKRLSLALEELKALGAEAIVHCGDLGAADCLRALGRAGIPAHAVAGNMDRHLPSLPEIAAGASVQFSPLTVEVAIGDGNFLAATHGHHEHVLAELIVGGRFPYVCHGHTHACRDERSGGVHVINPGAISTPYRLRPHPSAALLNTVADDVTFVEGF